LPDDLPLLRAVVMQPFIKVAREIGAPVEKILHRAGLPEELTTDPDIFWPEHLCWHFVQAVSRAEGIPDFGLVAGKTIGFPDLAEMIPSLAGSSNLYALLKRFCLVASLYSTNILYVLEEEERIVRFSEKGSKLITGAIQVELFQVLGMIQIVQLGAGADWRPDDIYFTFKRQFVVENAVDLNPSRIHFSASCPSITFPRDLLSMPALSPGIFAKPAADVSANLTPMPISFKEGMRDALIPYLGTENFTKNKAADILGISPRTLHRRLAGENVMYSEVLGQARLIKASKLLQQEDIRLMDITLMLGYENASSFTRAFRRWAGISPREYRNLQANR